MLCNIVAQLVVLPRIQSTMRELQITVHHSNSGSMDESKEYANTVDDEAWLTRHPGHPRDGTSDKSTKTRDS